MKLGFLFFGSTPDYKWNLVKQMGINHAIAKLAPDLTGRMAPYHYASLEKSVQIFKDEGLELIGLEGDQFDMSRIKLGLNGRNEDIDNYCQMLVNMGKLNINLLCYNFMVAGWYRTHTDQKGRGNALVTAFDKEYIDRLPLDRENQISADKLWDNYEYFISKVIPVAESEGIKMALHPDDPPVSSIQGVARIFIDSDAIRKALSLSTSPSHGLTFCQGTYVTMGEDILNLIQEWGSEDKIHFVHIRDVNGNRNRFVETFHDNGPTDMPKVLKAYRTSGFNGYLRSDHVPTMEGETNERPGYGIYGNLFGIGYIKGIVHSLKA
ncbi:mannonate dehydratase [Ulvibacterium marinum]|uniref:mannonate dehydratase n=1 Tax=Ulvibacterium marinum TaxID=2419782 RepID=A0A3B0BVE2_9FLAO|nr:mannonate dehydratase [Ulvibacterium marinum]RKN77002.1 mannonate dehydratase [Ulvibacterium marinum]